MTTNAEDQRPSARCRFKAEFSGSLRLQPTHRWVAALGLERRRHQACHLTWTTWMMYLRCRSVRADHLISHSAVLAIQVCLQMECEPAWIHPPLGLGGLPLTFRSLNFSCVNWHAPPTPKFVRHKQPRSVLRQRESPFV